VQQRAPRLHRDRFDLHAMRGGSTARAPLSAQCTASVMARTQWPQVMSFTSKAIMIGVLGKFVVEEHTFILPP
jgi:hypothetical protein